MKTIEERAENYAKDKCEFDKEANMAQYEWHRNAYIQIAEEQKKIDAEEFYSSKNLNYIIAEYFRWADSKERRNGTFFDEWCKEKLMLK